MQKTLSALSRVLLILAGSLLAYGSASACKCAVRTVEEKLAGSASVFRGIVLQATPLATGGGQVLSRRYRFAVARTWKGPADSIVEVSSGTMPVACGMVFDVGSEYLIYAFEDGGLLATGLCAGNMTTGSEYALQEIAELDRLVEDQLKQMPGSLPMEGSPCSGG